MLTFIICCVCIGSFAGFLNGLLGIGGGLFLIPALTYSLYLIGINSKYTLIVALATSIATISITSISGAIKHHSLKNIEYSFIRKSIIFIIIGVGLGSYCASHINQEIIAICVIVAMCYLTFIAAKKLISHISVKKEVTVNSINIPIIKNSIIITIIGFICGITGMSGGAFYGIYLNKNNLPLKKAVGSSSVAMVITCFIMTVFFIIYGFNADLKGMYLGYVYIPGFLAVVSSSIIASRLGASATTIFPVLYMRIISVSCFALGTIFMLIKFI
ncbi:MAG: sulfite exporter TauE/SafE family protein [Psittacicella sp.]